MYKSGINISEMNQGMLPLPICELISSSYFNMKSNMNESNGYGSPTNAKNILRDPSIRSMRLKSAVSFCLSLSPYCLSFFLCICRKGHFIDHHRPNSRKNVPGNACPLKLAILPLEEEEKKPSNIRNT